MNEQYETQIINSFPYPIVTRFNKLKVPEFYQPSVNRLQHILATAESISRFLGIIVLCECRELAEITPEAMDDSPFILKNLSERFKKPVWGTWQEVMREGLKWLHRHEASLLIAELYPSFFNHRQKATDTAVAMDELLNIRNSLQHHKVKTNARILCKNSEIELAKTFEGIAFLLNYKFSIISTIEVHKCRKQDANFCHFIGSIEGKSREPMGYPKIFDFYMEPKCTLLVNPQTHQYLNLDPFLVYEEYAGNAKDVFFLNGIKNPNNIDYSACDPDHGTFKGNIAERADDIQREIQHLLDIFKQPTTTE